VSKDGDSFTHYLVVGERILGEALVVEKLTDWVSLGLVKLAISGPKTSICCFAFVENQALVPKILNRGRVRGLGTLECAANKSVRFISMS